MKTGKKRLGESCCKEQRGSKAYGFWALYKKEMADHINSRRFYLIFALLLVVSAASLMGAVSSISDAVSESSEFIFLKLFTTGSSSIYSFATFMAFLGPLAGITLGFDAVNNERSQGTLIRLASQPIYRDSIVSAKFLAGSSVLLLMVTVLGLFFSGTGLVLIGVAPGVEEALRIIAFLLLTWVYLSFWLALSIVFSVVCKHAATAAISGISIWLFLSLFMSLVAAGISDLIYPTDGIQGFYNMMDNYNLELTLNRFSPYYLFSEAASTILNPNVRSIGVVTMSQLEGAVASSLSLGQSLLLVWPHLVVMAALTMAGFAIAYIKFMRQEIRA